MLFDSRPVSMTDMYNPTLWRLTVVWKMLKLGIDMGVVIFQDSSQILHLTQNIIHIITCNKSV